MKFLLDENAEGFEKELVSLGHEVVTAKKLRKEDEKFRNDYNLMNHAKEHKMIIITKDNEKGQACNDNKIRCIWIKDDEVFEKIILSKIDEFEE